MLLTRNQTKNALRYCDEHEQARWTQVVGKVAGDAVLSGAPVATVRTAAQPDEWLNRDLKTELRTRPATSERDVLKRMASSFLDSLASLPQRVMGYFKHEHV